MVCFADFLGDWCALLDRACRQYFTFGILECLLLGLKLLGGMGFWFFSSVYPHHGSVKVYFITFGRSEARDD